MPSEIRLKIKFGFDGSGSHSIFKQINNVQTNNMILTMFCPIGIESVDGLSLWSQDSPNAPQSQRPVALQMGKETLENVKTLLIFN